MRRLLLLVFLLALTTSSRAQTVATCPQIPNALCKDGTVPLTADWSVNSHKITNLTDPAALQDAATKNYVDQLAGGLETRAVRLATAAALPANTYNNGVAGIGATLTATANGALSIDSTTVAVGDRVLVKNESAQANQGVYVVTATGSGILPYILTRSIDSDDADDFAAAVVLVTAGSANANTAWLCVVGTSITVGTTSIPYTQYQVGQGTTVGGDTTGTVGNMTVAKINGTGGTGNQTLRSNGTTWVASSALQNDGTNVTLTGNLTVNGTVSDRRTNFVMATTLSANFGGL